jgi:pimeloyl-ACP methyl ester carboxylesterase
MSVFNPLPVEPIFFSWRGHHIAGYSDGAGPKLLLVHSINAAASAFEMRGPFTGLRDSFHVQALDLLGYGRSDRPARSYMANDYIELIGHMLQLMGAGTAVVAGSLSAAFAVKVAVRWPSLVRALVLICPTGIAQLAQPPGPPNWAAYRLLQGSLGEGLFRALTTRAGTRFFLERQAYAQPESITPETLDGFYLTTRPAGARYAPLCFVTGLLNCNIAADFAEVTQPVLVVWGREATTTPLPQADAFLARNAQVQLKSVADTSMLVQDERPAEFNAIVRDFLL